MRDYRGQGPNQYPASLDPAVYIWGGSRFSNVPDLAITLCASVILAAYRSHGLPRSKYVSNSCRCPGLDSLMHLNDLAQLTRLWRDSGQTSYSASGCTATWVEPMGVDTFHTWDYIHPRPCVCGFYLILPAYFDPSPCRMYSHHGYSMKGDLYTDSSPTSMPMAEDAASPNRYQTRVMECVLSPLKSTILSLIAALRWKIDAHSFVPPLRSEDLKNFALALLENTEGLSGDDPFFFSDQIIGKVPKSAPLL
ncbi:hypothetical protein VNO77_44017 [Canavalia gladiata]|uniref:Uncharacterized protein n=1 Tax=Canavalia gladiata TaxID=3824 RepID=A0AAN9JY61_CANGL